MKRFIIKCLLFLVVLLSTLAAWVVGVPMERNNYLYALNMKDSLLEHTPSPRIIMAAGSSFAFGLDSKMLQDSLGMNVVNTSLHAGLGLKYILDDIIQYLRPGDVVVLGLEYQHLYNQMYGDEVTLGPAMYYTHYRNLHLLNRQQLLSIATGLPFALRMNWKSRRDREKPIYTARAINRWGDEEGHRTVPPHHAMEYIYPENIPINPTYCACLKERLLAIEQKGCTIILTPAPMYEGVYDERIDREVSAALKDMGYAMNVPYANHLYPDSLMYDTSYHLNGTGVEVFTQDLIRELRQAVSTR